MMILLAAVLVSYPVAGSVGGPVWVVAASGACLSLVLARAGLRLGPGEVLRRGVSWETLAFLLALLVMSLGLRDVGLVDRLSSLYAGSGLGTIGLTSALGSALLNNHPMAQLNMLALDATASADRTRILAALVGGDLGPRLLPTGSLAGLLWLEQLRRHGVSIGTGQFLQIGLLLTLPALAASLAILALH
jgi:arsenical pump membrane protein